MSDLQAWIERGILLIGGGGLFKLGDFILKKKQADNDDFSLLRETYREEFIRYRDEIKSLITQNTQLEERLINQGDRLETKIADLQLETELLREQLKNLSRVHPDLPIPMWLKDQNGIMLSLNQAYEDAFLIPQGKTRFDYIGKHDDDIWGEKVADIFRANDIIAMSMKRASFVLNEEEADHLLNGWEFFKYPKYSDGTFVGVGGMALPRENKKVNFEN